NFFILFFFFFFQAEDGIRDLTVTGVQTCALPICRLVTCDDHGHAHIWEVATGQLAFTLDYPDGDIANVFFTKDGRSLITSNHREVIVWDLSPEPGAEKKAWADLAHEAPKAEQARRAMLANPEAVNLLRSELRP